MVTNKTTGVRTGYIVNNNEFLFFHERNAREEGAYNGAGILASDGGSTAVVERRSREAI